jgi:hypothetical protein
VVAFVFSPNAKPDSPDNPDKPNPDPKPGPTADVGERADVLRDDGVLEITVDPGREEEPPPPMPTERAADWRLDGAGEGGAIRDEERKDELGEDETPATPDEAEAEAEAEVEESVDELRLLGFRMALALALMLMGLVEIVGVEGLLEFVGLPANPTEVGVGWADADGVKFGITIGGADGVEPGVTSPLEVVPWGVAGLAVAEAREGEVGNALALERTGVAASYSCSALSSFITLVVVMPAVDAAPEVATFPFVAGAEVDLDGSPSFPFKFVVLSPITDSRSLSLSSCLSLANRPAGSVQTSCTLCTGGGRKAEDGEGKGLVPCGYSRESERRGTSVEMV